MVSKSHPGQHMVSLAAIGVVLISVVDSLPSLVRGLVAVALVALMFAGIALQWRDSQDEVRKDARRSAAATAIPAAFVLTMISVLAVRYSASGEALLVGIAQGGDGAPKVFALGALLAFAWIVVIHLAAQAVWWARRR